MLYTENLITRKDNKYIFLAFVSLLLILITFFMSINHGFTCVEHVSGLS